MEISLNYPSGPNVITKVLKSGRVGQKKLSECSDLRKTQLAVVDFEDGGNRLGGNVCGQPLEACKGKRQFLL